MKKIITHSGTFHTDEIFAIVLLAKFYFSKSALELDITRTRDRKELDCFLKDKNTFVIDVGGEFDPKNLNFDHHQEDPRLVWREEQKPSNFTSNEPFKKSSCGLIWDWLLENGNEEFQSFDCSLKNEIEKIVKKVDLSDNGQDSWPEVRTYSRFNRKKTNEDGEVLNNKEFDAIQFEQFKKAIQVAEWFFENLLSLKSKIGINKKKVKASIVEAEENDHQEVLFFENDPFNSKHLGSVYSDEAKIIAVYDEEDKTWSLKVVNYTPNVLFKGRLKMPSKWAGLQGEELQKVSGFYYASFCHKDRFMMTLDDCTKEECLEICYEIIRVYERGDD